MSKSFLLIFVYKNHYLYKKKEFLHLPVAQKRGQKFTSKNETEIQLKRKKPHSKDDFFANSSYKEL